MTNFLVVACLATLLLAQADKGPKLPDRLKFAEKHCGLDEEAAEHSHALAVGQSFVSIAESEDLKNLIQELDKFDVDAGADAATKLYTHLACLLSKIDKVWMEEMAGGEDKLCFDGDVDYTDAKSVAGCLISVCKHFLDLNAALDDITDPEAVTTVSAMDQILLVLRRIESGVHLMGELASSKRGLHGREAVVLDMLRSLLKRHQGKRSTGEGDPDPEQYAKENCPGGDRIEGSLGDNTPMSMAGLLQDAIDSKAEDSVQDIIDQLEAFLNDGAALELQDDWVRLSCDMVPFIVGANHIMEAGSSPPCDSDECMQGDIQAMKAVVELLKGIEGDVDLEEVLLPMEILYASLSNMERVLGAMYVQANQEKRSPLERLLEELLQ